MVRVLLQRVTRASVTIDSNVTASIGRGLVVLVGLTQDDTVEKLGWIQNKIVGLKLWPDEDKAWSKNVKDIGGELLVVSQFTLYGSCTKGTKPAFHKSANPPVSEPLYNSFVSLCRDVMPDGAVKTGSFGAMMAVELVNDGPVTFNLEK